MNEQTRIRNEKDLKFYKLMIVMTFVASIVIALVVGIVTIDSYKAEAAATNAVINVLMPKQIQGTEGDAKDLVFYREKNKEYDANKDEPLKAFNYYMLNDKGEKIYLEDGMYYPPSYYMENSETEPVVVYLGFFARMLQNLQIVKNVITVVAVILGLGVLALIIYAWYRIWSKREDERIAREKEFNERMNKKNL